MQSDLLAGTIESSALYSLAADALLVTHVLVAAFVILGLILVYTGRFLSWHWVRNRWFRVAHLLGTGIVVLQSWFGAICPLTIWEMKLRSMAGGATYAGSFIMHWLSEILYYQAPPWVFVTCYTFFGCLVLYSWFLVRPR
jgi:hypothetical protein